MISEQIEQLDRPVIDKIQDRLDRAIEGGQHRKLIVTLSQHGFEVRNLTEAVETVGNILQQMKGDQREYLRSEVGSTEWAGLVCRV